MKIGRDAEYPTAFVQQRFDQLTSTHIEKVLDGIWENTTRVRNAKAYLLAALFNSPSDARRPLLAGTWSRFRPGYAYLKEAIDANPDLDFYIFATAGSENDYSGTFMLAEDMQKQMAYFASQTDTFSFGLDPSVNNLYFVRSNFTHLDYYFPYSLANAGQVFFK